MKTLETIIKWVIEKSSQKAGKGNRHISIFLQKLPLLCPSINGFAGIRGHIPPSYPPPIARPLLISPSTEASLLSPKRGLYSGTGGLLCPKKKKKEIGGCEEMTGAKKKVADFSTSSQRGPSCDIHRFSYPPFWPAKNLHSGLFFHHFFHPLSPPTVLVVDFSNFPKDS